MQSEPINTPEHVSQTTSLDQPANTSQHGSFDEQHGRAGLPGRRRSQIDVSRDAFSASRDCGHDAGSTSAPRLQEQLQGLNIESYKSRPSFQRISEYENALSPSPPKKQKEGPGFIVTKKKAGVGSDGPRLDSFPNEVLTHILSHLPAASLSAVSLVSRQFYSLITTPHAWRIAFSRFFPGHDSLGQTVQNRRGSDNENWELLKSEQRLFTRLTGLSSWRSEYILRTRLLRSLGRGKPAQLLPGHGASSRSNSAANNANAVVTYTSQLSATINHIHAVFSSGKKPPRFIHGTDETGSACTSDPNIGKIDNWGLGDPQALPQFSDLFVGDLPYGEGEGLTGLPNSMDVSQPFGMMHGEGFPGGQLYFRSSEEQRGRFLTSPSDLSDYQSGIPRVPLTEAISSVWIAKSCSVPQMTDGLVGMMTGSTLGVVTAYTLGADTSHGRRLPRGQLTCKWIISPGIPIVNIQIDDSFNQQRRTGGRVWAFALNALGEVYALSETPQSLDLDDGDPFRQAWTVGRTAYWNLIEISRREAREDPYGEAEIHGSYSPRSSAAKMGLSNAQVGAETAEIEKFLNYRAAHFRKICHGWDMHRRMEVDFGGDDGSGAGESVIIVNCGKGEAVPEIRRYTRWRSEQASLEDYPLPKTPPLPHKLPTMASLFGGHQTFRGASDSAGKPAVLSPIKVPSPKKTSPNPISPKSRPSLGTGVEEWRMSFLAIKDQHPLEITSVAIDMSIYALLTVDEDPLLKVNGSSVMSSPSATPPIQGFSSTLVPGQRSRLFAAGTSDGTVLIWNVRAPQSANAAIANNIQSLRMICTDSPQISCLALTALQIVVGGNDGLVQSWDPLASTDQPIRTLNSRFSSRARRRLVQAEASIHGVGINLYAAGAIVLDPDPTVLRGMVSLGTHLRYWSYSSVAADQYQSKKRRLRRSGERGSNSGPDRFSNTGRGALMDYIATEQEELRKDKLRRSREEARLRGRFGVGLAGLTEEEAIAYAEMISAQSYQESASVSADTGDESSGIQSSTTVTPEPSITGRAPLASPQLKTDDEFEHDIEEAIRLSLLDGINEEGTSPRASGSGQYDIPIRYKEPKQSRRSRSASTSPSSSKASKNRRKGTSNVRAAAAAVAPDDLDYALQLSLIDERNRADARGEEVLVGEGNKGSDDDFPALQFNEFVGKGKGRAP